MNGPEQTILQNPPKCNEMPKLPTNGVLLNCCFLTDLIEMMRCNCSRYSICGQELPAFGHLHREKISEAHSRSLSISYGDAAALKSHLVIEPKYSYRGSSVEPREAQESSQTQFC
jgi:hypothetical protein